MDARDVAEVVAFLEGHGLEVFVDGGWAVDALLGEQTRPHSDLDIAMPHKQVPRWRTLRKPFWRAGLSKQGQATHFPLSRLVCGLLVRLLAPDFGSSSPRPR